MSANHHTQAYQVWSSLDQAARQEIVDEFRQVVKEMINEHFRISSATPPESSCNDLRAAVEPQPGHYQQGESANAVRAA